MRRIPRRCFNGVGEGAIMQGTRCNSAVVGAILSFPLVGLIAGCGGAPTQETNSLFSSPPALGTNSLSPSANRGHLEVDPGWTKVWEGGSDRNDESSSFSVPIAVTMIEAKMKWSITSVRPNPFGGPPSPKLSVAFETADLYGLQPARVLVENTMGSGFAALPGADDVRAPSPPFQKLSRIRYRLTVSYAACAFQVLVEQRN
jgi:hypothetical protein